MDHLRTQPIGERRTRDCEGGQRLPNQWPIHAAGAQSTISGVGFAAVAVAVADDTVHLGMLALYAATGGVFVIQAGLLARRSHRLPNPPPPCRLNRSVDVGWVSTSGEGSAAEASMSGIHRYDPRPLKTRISRPARRSSRQRVIRPRVLAAFVSTSAQGRLLERV